MTAFFKLIGHMVLKSEEMMSLQLNLLNNITHDYEHYSVGQSVVIKHFSESQTDFKKKKMS